MPARLEAGDPCTGGSKARATAVPWEQQNLQLARTWAFGKGAGVKVAVVDTGVSARYSLHCLANLYGETAEVIRSALLAEDVDV
ncbi:hypothetical protein AB0O83_31435, partial [Streptomyces sp. NPDC088141]